MSFQAMTWAVKQKVGNATGKAILLMLANYADKDGYCMPGQKTLAMECECSERTIRDWLTKFEEMALVKRDERRRDDGYRTSDAIVLQLDSSPADVAAEISPAAFSPENSSPENPSDLTGSSCRAINRTSQVNRKTNTTANEPTQFDELAKVLDGEHANAVIAHRKNFKAKFTPYAAKLLAAKFARCADPNAAADAMIVNGWQGFEPQWLERNQARGSPRQPAERYDPFKALAEELDDGQDRSQRSNRRDWDDAQGVPFLTIEHH